MDKASELEKDLEVFEIFIRSKIPVETEKFVILNGMSYKSKVNI